MPFERLCSPGIIFLAALMCELCEYGTLRYVIEPFAFTVPFTVPLETTRAGFIGKSSVNDAMQYEVLYYV